MPLDGYACFLEDRLVSKCTREGLADCGRLRRHWRPRSTRRPGAREESAISLGCQGALEREMRKATSTFLLLMGFAACLALSGFTTGYVIKRDQNYIPLFSLGCVILAVFMGSCCGDPNYDEEFGNPFGDEQAHEALQVIGAFLCAFLVTSAFFAPWVAVLVGKAQIDLIYFTTVSSFCGGMVLIAVHVVVLKEN